MLRRLPFDLDSRNFDEPELSDLKVVCHDSTYHVHRLVVAAQSGFFRRAMHIDMKVLPLPSPLSLLARSTWHRVVPTVDPLANRTKQEKHTGVIELPEDDPTDVHWMLKHMYFGYKQCQTNCGHKCDWCSVKNVKSPSQHEPLLSSARKYAMAAKYDVPLLKKYATLHFGHHLQQRGGPPAPDSFDLPHLARFVYESTAPNERDLRDLLVPFARGNMQAILKAHPSFRAALEEVDGLAADIAASIGAEEEAAKGKAGKDKKPKASKEVRYGRLPPPSTKNSTLCPLPIVRACRIFGCPPSDEADDRILAGALAAAVATGAGPAGAAGLTERLADRGEVVRPKSAADSLLNRLTPQPHAAPAPPAQTPHSRFWDGGSARTEDTSYWAYLGRDRSDSRLAYDGSDIMQWPHEIEDAWEDEY